MNTLRKTILALIAVCLTIGYIWYGNRTVTPNKATVDDVRAEAARGGYRLISTADLWQKYEADPDGLLMVDTRQEWEYRSGHIKGAINFPMEPTWLSRWRKKGDLEAVLGPDRNRPIVFY
ncbi:MAG: rhodanese-like domain-containing protein [Deltaproteobacteria bacterium]|nr:rhodanese-like domain-containing protein [Deltaproteobacteria bacterium]